MADSGQVTDLFSTPQLWITNDPDHYSVTTRNRAGPNTAGKGNVGGQTHDFRDSQDIQMGTIDDRGIIFNRAVVGMTGEIKFFPFLLSPVPDGLLYCDGSPVSRVTYAGLFLKIGTTFGVGDGSTTFNVPNIRDVVIGGVGPTNYTNSTTVFGSNATVNLQHFHSGDVHTHDISNHTHDLSNHTHTLNGHVHGLNSHTHHNSHNHNITTASGQTSGDGSFSSGPQKTGNLTNFDLNDTGHTHGLNHAHGGATQGSNTADTDGPSTANTNSNTDNSSVPSANVTGVPSANITGNPSAANTGNALSATQSIIQATLGYYFYIKT